MPVRRFGEVLRWPDRDSVLAAVRAWAEQLKARDTSVQSVLLIGSYARGDWGVGSDVDLVVIVDESPLTPEQRYVHYYPDELPLPANLWVYTQAEWNTLSTNALGLWARLQREQMPL